MASSYKTLLTSKKYDCKMTVEPGLPSTVRQHRLDSVHIGARNEYIDVQLPLPLGRLLSQNVAGVGMATFDLPGRGSTKPLGRPFVRFEFWHNFPFLDFEL